MFEIGNKQGRQEVNKNKVKNPEERITIENTKKRENTSIRKNNLSEIYESKRI